jgi:hypothetical protein
LYVQNSARTKCFVCAYLTFLLGFYLLLTSKLGSGLGKDKGECSHQPTTPHHQHHTMFIDFTEPNPIFLSQPKHITIHHLTSSHLILSAFGSRVENLGFNFIWIDIANRFGSTSLHTRWAKSVHSWPKHIAIHHLTSLYWYPNAIGREIY